MIPAQQEGEGARGFIRYRQIFSGGYRTKMKIWSDANEKLVGKFFARLWCAKKGVLSKKKKDRQLLVKKFWGSFFKKFGRFFRKIY